MSAIPGVDFKRLYVLSYIKVSQAHFDPQNTFEAFFPFVIAAADPSADAKFDPLQIGASLRSSLGWPVGGDFAELFASDLERRGYVTAPDQNQTRRWTELAVRPAEDGSTAQIEHLQANFFGFSERLSGLFLQKVSAEDRLHALANALVTNRLFSIDALQEYASRGPVDESGTAPIGSALSGKDFDYLCARFIKESYSHDKESFDALLVLSNIGVVTQLANFFHKRDENIETTGSPDVILDGPFLIDYVGLNGEARREDAEIIVKSAKGRNCRIGAFKHSVFEATDIVKAVRNNEPYQRYGPLALALRNSQISLEALDAFLQDPFGLITRMDLLDFVIDIESRNNKWQDEDFRDEDWQAVYAQLLGWKDLARKRDADSVSGIMKERAGHITRSPWRAKSFLLTSNDALARKAKAACVEKGLIDQGDIGPAISRNEFAAIIWLAGNENNKNEIVTAHLLSAAQGLLARDKQLIDRVRDYSENLSEERQELLKAIVSTELSYEMLQDVTLGNPDRLTDDTLDRVVSALVEKGRREGDSAAREDEKRSTARLRNEATQSRAAEEEALDRAQRAEAEAARLDGEAGAASAALLTVTSRMQAVELEKVQSDEKAIQLLKAAQKAQTALARTLDGKELDWTKILHHRRWACSAALYVAAFIVFAAITYLGWILRGVTGSLGAGAVSFVIAIFLVTNEWLKAAKGRLETQMTESITRSALVKPIRRLERQLGLGTGSVQVNIAEQVRIKDRDKLIN